MAYLHDTGILLRTFDPTADGYDEVLRGLDLLWRQEEQLFVTVQNLAEFWNVATRPRDRNGLGINVANVNRQLHVIEELATVLTETNRSFIEWKRLVVEHDVIGTKVHDAWLVSV